MKKKMLIPCIIGILLVLLGEVCFCTGGRWEHLSSVRSMARSGMFSPWMACLMSVPTVPRFMGPTKGSFWALQQAEIPASASMRSRAMTPIYTANGIGKDSCTNVSHDCIWLEKQQQPRRTAGLFFTISSSK